ncbi:MAG: M28 family peptidase [Bacteroidota bacterium]|nr:M28 family peptidase [Bacteroidota bacterium]
MSKSFYFIISLIIFLFISVDISAQKTENFYAIIEAVSEERIKSDITTLVEFGTRHTLSDTLSKKRGIGAARRWIFNEFQKIAKACGGCIEVSYQKNYHQPDGRRIIKPVWINNVMAIQRGAKYPNRFIIMSGDIDSRISDPTNYIDDSPGANDNASGMAGTIETARILSNYRFESSIIYAGLAGEEQGLYGGAGLAKHALEKGWEIIGVLNNDMIGNIKGVDGVIDNRTFRIFSEPTPANESENMRKNRRFYGGEVDGISRQLARYIYKTVKTYMPEMNPKMIYRLDRFGRGGHHRPFNDVGFAGVRIMEAHENYTQQHQDIRMEDGIAYGDVIEAVNFSYAKKLTAVNAINLAALAWSPPSVSELSIGGVVEPSVKLKWNKLEDDAVAGYKIYWRDTTSPTWDYSRFVGNVEEITLEGIVIDNYFFGVSTVGKNGMESRVVFPSKVIR